MTTQRLDTQLKQNLKLSLSMRRSLQCLLLPQHQLRYAIMDIALDNPFLVPTPIEYTPPSNPTASAHDDTWWENIAGESKPSLYEVLLDQLRLMPIPEALEPAFTCLIDSLDEYGFLTHHLPILSQTYDIPLEELEIAYTWFEELDPPGIGCQNLAAFWQYQIENSKGSPVAYDALALVEQGMKWMLPLQKNKLKTLLDNSETRTTLALAFIKKLKHHPFEPSSSMPHPLDMIPELQLKRDASNEIRVDFIQPTLSWEVEEAWMGTSFEKERKLLSYRTEANRFIEGLKQRQQTILQVADSIFKHQPYFWEYGLKGLRPLTLEPIATTLSYHLSTISRAIQYKAILTPHGTFMLSDFFPSGLKSTHQEADKVSSAWVQGLLREWIDEEPKKSPLTDQELVERYHQHGVTLSRRTVAKYREVMHIPCAYHRKIS